MNKRIDTTTIEELYKENKSGHIPVLLDIISDEIIWDDNYKNQENGHMRLINSDTAVMYNGNKYLPAYFSCSLPQEDGKKIGNASITISAIDQRIIQIIRSITQQPKCVIESVYAKMKTEDDHTVFVFKKLNKYEFAMSSVSWNESTADWTLVFDPAMQINVPKDKGSIMRNPAIYEQKN